MFRKKNNRSADKGQSEQVTEVMNGNLPNGGGLQEPPEDPSVSGKVSPSDDSAEKESVHPVDLESISGVVRVTAAEMGIGNAAGGKASAGVSGQDSSSGKNTESSVSSSEESAKEENSAGSSRKSSRSSGKSEAPEAADAGNVKADNPVSEKKGGSGDSEVKTSESGNRGRKSSGKRISGEEVTAATGAGDSDKDKGDSAATLLSCHGSFINAFSRILRMPGLPDSQNPHFIRATVTIPNFICALMSFLCFLRNGE